MNMLDLWWALSKLTPLQREVFVDRHLVGRTVEEISAELGVSRQRVGQILSVAMRHVRQTLEPDEQVAA